MPKTNDSTLNGAEARAARTDAALVRAAQEILAETGNAVSVKMITDHAGVAVGSLYNRFGSKEELFGEACRQALVEIEADSAKRTEQIQGPAARFAMRTRIYLRTPQTAPLLAQLMTRPEARMAASPKGYSEAALRDVKAAIKAGRFHCKDPQTALIVMGGAANSFIARALASGSFSAQKADALTEYFLTELLGVSAREAAELAREPIAPAAA